MSVPSVGRLCFLPTMIPSTTVGAQARNKNCSRSIADASLESHASDTHARQQAYTLFGIHNAIHIPVVSLALPIKDTAFFLFIRVRHNGAKPRTDALRYLLLQRTASAATLAAALRISQPTFSRLWPCIPDCVALGASKARLHARTRMVKSSSARGWPIWRRTGTTALRQCLPMADQFWTEVLDDTSISDDFKHNVAARDRITLNDVTRLGSPGG